MTAQTQTAKHTPGPWRIDGSRHSTTQGTDDFYVSHGNQDTVSPLLARVLSDGGRLPTEANAALIAAAPDLLAACRNALDTITGNRVGGAISAEIELRTAIARAEGRAEA